MDTARVLARVGWPGLVDTLESARGPVFPPRSHGGYRAILDISRVVRRHSGTPPTGRVVPHRQARRERGGKGCDRWAAVRDHHLRDVRARRFVPSPTAMEHRVRDRTGNGVARSLAFPLGSGAAGGAKKTRRGRGGSKTQGPPAPPPPPWARTHTALAAAPARSRTPP